MKPGKLITGICLGMLLMSCQNDNQLAEGGITGSGISVGPITAFGSVWVGGIRYDVSNAAFVRNNLPEQLGQDAFRVGEIVNIVGSVNADGVTGVANKVEFDRNLSGPITQIGADGKTINVLEQQVATDVLTLFSGFNLLSELQPGNIVEISGSRTPEGSWVASTINRVQDAFIAGGSEFEVEGRVSAVQTDQQLLNIGNLSINYASSLSDGIPDLNLAVGQYVEVKTGADLQQGQLVANTIEPKVEYPPLQKERYTRVDGRITDFSTPLAFDVNGQATVITGTTALVNGSDSDLGLNAHLSLEGFVNANGVLEADRVTIRQSTDPAALQILTTRIESIDPAAFELTIAGSTVKTDNTTIIQDYRLTETASIRLTDLLINDVIRISGRKVVEGQIVALRIERNPPTQPETETSTQDDGETSNTPANSDNGSGTDTNTTNSSENNSDVDSSDNPAANGTDSTDESDEGAIKITGPATHINQQNRTFMIDRIIITTDNNTRYLHADSADNTLDQAAFFKALNNDNQRVRASGYFAGNNRFHAATVNILTD